VVKRTAVKKKNSPGKKSTARKPARPKARHPAPLERLRSDESLQVLLSLIRRHPDLAPEADELALALIETVDAKEVGLELGQRLLELDIFDAIDTAPRDGRYVPIWDAAQQTLDCLLEPYLADLQRRVELGLKEAAQSTCFGIILGLYHARGCESDDSLLAHAPDFCQDEAHYVVGLLAKQSGRLHRRRWSLPEGSDELLSEWPWLFPRGARRKKRR
jgi:hypothetical protein